MVRRGRRSIPPSRRRYEASHPVVSVRVDVATRRRLDELATKTGRSLGRLLLEGLGQVERDVTDVFERGRNEGLQEGHEEGVSEGFMDGYGSAVEEFRIEFHCSKCHDLIALLPGDRATRVALDAVIAQGWGHTVCPKPHRPEGAEG